MRGVFNLLWRFKRRLFWLLWRGTHWRQIREAERVWDRLSDDQKREVVYKTLTG